MVRPVLPSVSGDTPEWRVLRQVPLLAGLTDERVCALWDGSIPRRHPAGQVLRAEGESAGHLLLLTHGRVSATVSTSAGRLIRVGTWAAPCALDKIAVIDGGGHTATLTALEPCWVRSVRREHFLALIDNVASVRRHVLRVLADNARQHQQRFTDAVTMSGEARLAAWLLAEAAAERNGSVAVPGTQQELADLLGVTRVTVNRALSRLRRDGLIETHGANIDIRAPELLERRAHTGSRWSPS